MVRADNTTRITATGTSTDTTGNDKEEASSCSPNASAGCRDREACDGSSRRGCRHTGWKRGKRQWMADQRINKLTLFNPAYMTRQVFEMKHKPYGSRGHITSLNPIRPENRADSWESEALTGFQAGSEDFSSLEVLDGQPVLRYMRVLLTEQHCLPCRAFQGYKQDDMSAKQTPQPIRILMVEDDPSGAADQGIETGSSGKRTGLPLVVDSETLWPSGSAPLESAVVGRYKRNSIVDEFFGKPRIGRLSSSPAPRRSSLPWTPANGAPRITWSRVKFPEACCPGRLFTPSNANKPSRNCAKRSTSPTRWWPRQKQK